MCFIITKGTYSVSSSLSFIAGFLELGKDDQICLIRHGLFEVILAWFTLMLQEDGMFTPGMETKIPR